MPPDVETVARELLALDRESCRRRGVPLNPLTDVEWEALPETCKENMRDVARWHLNGVAESVHKDEHRALCGARNERVVRWLAKHHVIEGIAPLTQDLHEIACEAAVEWGREEPTVDDYQEALLRMVEAAAQVRQMEER
jgi:hypothetical protein